MELSHKQRESIGFNYVVDQMRPNSAWGRQCLRELKPYPPAEKDQLLRELGNVEKTLAHQDAFDKEYKRLEHLFMQVKDIRGSIRHIENGVLGEVELFEIKRYLIQLGEILPLFDKINREARYNDIAFSDTRVALALLDPDRTGIASFHISERWSPGLAAVRREKKDVEMRLQELRGTETVRPATGGPPPGLHITRAVPPAEPVPAGPALREQLEAQRREIVAREQEEEEKVRIQLTADLRAFVQPMLANADAIAKLDVTIQKARLAREHGGVMPSLTETGARLAAMRNPMIQARLEAENKQFTPVSISLAPGATVITGANMGGKSVTLKTLALNLYLAQCGFYPFAESCATPLFAGLYLLSEDQEDTGRGLSSFGGEIVRFNEIDAALGEAPSLVLMDEFGRGTNPEEGAAIAQSVCAYLNAKPDYTVMTTHFDHVAGHAGAHYEVVGLKNADIAELAGRLQAAPLESRVAMIARQMDYGLVPVGKNSSMPHDALNICRLLGLNDNILGEIEKKLLTFDSGSVE